MRFTLIATAAVLAAASVASAHGVQTQLTYDIVGNKIDTRSIAFTSANTLGLPSRPDSVTPQRRAYIEPLLLSPIGAGTGWYARPDPELTAGVPAHPAGPGPSWQYADGLTNSVAGTGWSYSGSTALPNLQATAFTYKLLDGLKQWNGTSFVDPGAEQLQMIASDGTTSFTPTALNSVTTTDSGPFGALALSSITSRSSTNNAHSSLSFRLLGDGTTLADGDDGVYLLKLAIGTNATVGNTGTPVGDSDSVYFLFTKNAAYGDAFAAASSLGISPALIQGQVPEPATLAAVAGLAGLVLRCRR